MYQFRVVSVSVPARTSAEVTSRMLHLKQFRRLPDEEPGKRYDLIPFNECAYPVGGATFILELDREPIKDSPVPCNFQLFRSCVELPARRQITMGEIDLARLSQNGDHLVLPIKNSDDDMDYTFTVSPIGSSTTWVVRETSGIIVPSTN